MSTAVSERAARGASRGWAPRWCIEPAEGCTCQWVNRGGEIFDLVQRNRACAVHGDGDLLAEHTQPALDAIEQAGR